MGILLARATPGLPVYLGGGLAVWLICRALASHGLADSLLGVPVLGVVRLLGMALVVILYFRRTGQLTQAGADLHHLRHLLAERKPWLEAPTPSRRRLFRLLRWALRVRG